MRVKVKYIVGKSTKVEFVEAAKLSFKSVANVLGISTRQIISVIREV